MGSSITAAPLTIKITEDITLNGQQQGTTNTITTANIAEFSRRNVTIPTSEVTKASGATFGFSAIAFNTPA